MKALPYFKWYPADAEMDANFRAMEDADIGFYLRCLNHAWLNGGLPADPKERARVLRTRLDTANKRWLRVGKCFRTSQADPTILINPRQETERELASQNSQVAAESAKRRWVGNANALHAHMPMQSDSVSESGVLKSKPETNTTPRAPEPPPAPEPEQLALEPEVVEPQPSNIVTFGLPGIERQTEYPETLRAIHDYFPESDMRYVHGIVNAAGHAYAAVAEPQCAFTDQLVAEAVRRTYKSDQKGAGLFARTVPACVRTWAQEGYRGRASPPRAQSVNDRAFDLMIESLAAKAARSGVR